MKRKTALPKRAPLKPRRPIKKKAPPKKKKGAGFKTHNMRVTTSSKSHVWRTPETFIEMLVDAFGKIKLDPSADTKKRFQFAKTNYTGKEVDGLRAKWIKHGFVYCNPPYGRGLINWITKACKFGKKRFDTDQLVMLIPARPDTRWFHDHILKHADAWCFLKGRLKFGRGTSKHPAPFPSLVVYFGDRRKTFVDTFGPLGWVVTRNTLKTSKEK